MNGLTKGEWEVLRCGVFSIDKTTLFRCEPFKTIADLYDRGLITFKEALTIALDKYTEIEKSEEA